jgi:hypothetical protein
MKGLRFVFCIVTIFLVTPGPIKIALERKN